MSLPYWYEVGHNRNITLYYGWNIEDTLHALTAWWLMPIDISKEAASSHLLVVSLEGNFSWWLYTKIWMSYSGFGSFMVASLLVQLRTTRHANPGQWASPSHDKAVVTYSISHWRGRAMTVIFDIWSQAHFTKIFGGDATLNIMLEQPLIWQYRCIHRPCCDIRRISDTHSYESD